MFTTLHVILGVFITIGFKYSLCSIKSISTLSKFRCIYLLDSVQIHSNFDKIATLLVGRGRYKRLIYAKNWLYTYTNAQLFKQSL
jgi:hypothetical protein